MDSAALFHVAPGAVAWRPVRLTAPGAGEVRVAAEYSAISPGTEGLIFRGDFPRDLPLDASLPSLAGPFSYPFAYGYALVGRVVELGAQVASEWLDRRVFLFHPHQSEIVTSVRNCFAIPDGISPRSALFLPNLESALSFIMDAAPLVGESVVVLGQGVVGLLTTALLAQFPLRRLVAVDPLAYRRDWSREMGAGETIDPGDDASWGEFMASLGERGADLCFELSGKLTALNRAIALTGFSGRILIGSWYGLGDSSLDLGGHFHRRRLRLIASQVSTLSPELTGRWDKERRLELVWDWLRRLDPERLISHVFAPDQCQAAFAANRDLGDGLVQTIFQY